MGSSEDKSSESYLCPSPIFTWIILFLLVLLTATTASIINPATSLEKHMPVWPPGQPMGDYLKRILVHPLFRWDALDHLVKITARGYAEKNGSLAFFPLFPWTARILVFIGLDPFVSLMLVGLLASFGFMLVFERLARLDLSTRQARCVTDLLLVFPASMVLFLPYMEPLFMLLMTLSLYWMRQKRWWLAILSAASATLAKQPGIFLIIPLAMELWLSLPASDRWTRSAWKYWLALLLIPLAMLGWLVFRTFAIEKAVPDLGNLRDFALVFLMSSSAKQMVVSRPFAWPWQIVYEAAAAAFNKQQLQLHVLFNLGGYLLMALLLIQTWKHIRPTYRILALAFIVFSLLDFSFNRNAVPIPSLFRHAYLGFPVFLGLPHLLEKKWMRMIFILFSLIIFLMLVYFYGLRVWIV